LIYFVDRSLGTLLVVKALRTAGVAAIAHDELFDADCADEVWLEHCGREKFVALTRDGRIRYNALAKRAIRRFKVGLFVLVSGKLQGREQAELLVRLLPKIQRVSKKSRRPFIARLYKSEPVDVEEL
jgi:hypothetical protein